MKTKKKFKIKRIISLLLTLALISTLAAEFVYSGKDNLIYGAPEKVIFAEGFGTGKDFADSNGSWIINTVFTDYADSSYTSDDDNMAGIVENNHSVDNEPIIRLINGVQKADLNSAASDYRIGTAISSEKIKLDTDSQFSAKFTISMPDARVNNAQTNDHGDASIDTYAREVGGDGISFIITTSDSIVGRAGGGIGYDGVADSIIVELDSYFNGAYGTFAESSTAYINWEYDNQIYADSSYNFLKTVANAKYTDYSSAYNYGAFWDNVLNPNGYAQLSGSSTRRFDHVGVMLDGNPKTHIGISYLNGIDPSYVDESSNTYTNLNNSSSSTVSTVADCATRFADKDVDNRLFTFWIEYDGANMYVRYANGNFTEAVRPDEPQIKIEGNDDIANKFAGKEVNIGFTSAIGSSKANHTVHSVAFVNDYMEDGIKTSYTEKYYIETPDAESDYIKVNGKKYVLSETNTQSKIELGSSQGVTDKSNTDPYNKYDKVDTSSNKAYKDYPSSTDCVEADGSTILYQFYDIIPTFTVKYYLEVDSNTEDAIIVNGKYFKLEETVVKSASAGTKIKGDNSTTIGWFRVVTTDDSEEIDDTKKSYTNYVPDETSTNVAGKVTGTVAADNSTVIEFYYSRKVTSYEERYYIQDDTATGDDVITAEINGETHKYKLDYNNTVSDARAGTEVDVTDLSGTIYGEYNLLSNPSEYPSKSTVVLVYNYGHGKLNIL